MNSLSDSNSVIYNPAAFRSASRPEKSGGGFEIRMMTIEGKVVSAKFHGEDGVLDADIFYELLEKAWGC